MKKLIPFIITCLLLITGFATPASTTSFTGPVIAGEPEPHPNNIYVKLKINGQTTIIWVLAFPDETVGDVKSSVESTVGFSLNYLSYKGQVLNEEATLAFYGIGANATLNGY
ncbi:MAG: hypothetical protein J7621_04655 [Niastella sp.]|nr:hypothetical protein [Niastella sp.]